jgi:hypothetical protein
MSTASDKIELSHADYEESSSPIPPDYNKDKPGKTYATEYQSPRDQQQPIVENT